MVGTARTNSPPSVAPLATLPLNPPVWVWLGCHRGERPSLPVCPHWPSYLAALVSLYPFPLSFLSFLFPFPLSFLSFLSFLSPFAPFPLSFSVFLFLSLSVSSFLIFVPSSFSWSSRKAASGGPSVDKKEEQLLNSSASLLSFDIFENLMLNG